MSQVSFILLKITCYVIIAAKEHIAKNYSLLSDILILGWQDAYLSLHFYLQS